MHWEELLDEYRALGGVAENVRLGTGARGRGVFAIDPSKAATLHTPLSLNVPAESITVRDGRMTSDAPNLGTRERAFFERYQEHFGWGNGGAQQTREELATWNALPPDVIALIRSTIGANDLRDRFDSPTETACVDRYLQTRKFELPNDGGTWIVPMIDLINHAAGAQPYGVRDGIYVSGTFDGEMLVAYNTADPWGTALVYGFAASSPLAYSVSLSLRLHDSRTLSVSRFYGTATSGNTIQLPRVQESNGTIELSFLVLGLATAPDLPRAIFRKVMAGRLPAHETDRVFDGIAHYNQTYFIKLLRALRAHEGPLVRTLEDVAIDQLDALCAYVGARPL
jgi:hypothetical protein